MTSSTPATPTATPRRQYMNFLILEALFPLLPSVFATIFRGSSPDALVLASAMYIISVGVYVKRIEVILFTFLAYALLVIACPEPISGTIQFVGKDIEVDKSWTLLKNGCVIIPVLACIVMFVTHCIVAWRRIVVSRETYWLQ